MRNYFVLLSFLVTVCSCKSDYEFRDLALYTIDTAALKEGDTVKILYSSGGPDENKNMTYYYHLIAVNANKPSDTLNLFVTNISNVSTTNNIKIFIPKASETFNFLSFFINGQRPKDFNDFKVPQINKVVINKKFGDPKENHFPIVTGLISEYIPSLPDNVKQYIPQDVN